jgi:hypothetical protein
MWVLGGMPKVGKSMLVTKIGMNAAEAGSQIIYVDFENGVNKILLRIFSCLFRVSPRDMLLNPDSFLGKPDFNRTKERFMGLAQNLFIHRPSLRDLNKEGRKAPDLIKILLKKYVSYIRDELHRTAKILFIVDSLQKLPLWDIANRRADIDAWLRAMETIRDELDVSFLVVSELSRDKYDDVSIGSCKESGDIEYSCDILLHLRNTENEAVEKVLELECIASRDSDTGLIADYRPFFEYCDFEEIPINVHREEIRRGR